MTTSRMNDFFVNGVFDMTLIPGEVNRLLRGMKPSLRPPRSAK